MPNRYCLRCNQSIDHMAARAKYCSRSCSHMASSQRCKDRQAGKHVPFIEYGTPRKQCDECGQRVKVAGRMFCSRTCQTVARRKAAGMVASRSTEIQLFVLAENPRQRTSKNGEVSSRYFVHGSCKECGNTFTAVTRGKWNLPSYCSKRCSHRSHCRNAKHIRRERKKLNGKSDVSRSQIFKRDNYTCKLCNEPLDMDAQPNDNRAPSLDHIVPLAKGGSPTMSNLQAAHRLCNSIKCDRLELAIS